MIGSSTKSRTQRSRLATCFNKRALAPPGAVVLVGTRNAKFNRRGTATLEVALSLPLLLALMVAIIWLGAAVIAQSQVIVDARHQAWNERDKTPGTSLLFLKDDLISKSSTEELDAGPMFSNFEAAESSHDVMIGSWDHNKLKLDSAPNWQQYVVAAGNAVTGNLQTGVTNAKNSFTEWKGVAGTLWQTLAKDLIAELTGLGNSASSEMENGKAGSDGEDSRERQQLTQRIREKRAEIQAAERQLDTLKDQEDADEGLIEIYENRVTRLKADLEILKADKEASES